VATWHCFRCKERMVEDKVEIEFQEFQTEVEGIKCPKCGTKYLLEDTVREKVIKIEEEMSAK